MKKMKDTDYLYSSARVRALEQSLLNERQIDRMLDAPTDEEAVKILSESGYRDLPSSSLAQIERHLGTERNRVYALLASFVPNRNIIDVFRVKYDYHNLKVLIKADARGIDSDNLLINSGRYDVSALKDIMRQEKLPGMGASMAAAVTEARQVLARTADPQLSDLILDRACFDEMTDLTRGQSDFLERYVSLQTDAANLKTAVRSMRMNKSYEFLRRAFLSGGTVSPDSLMAVISGTSLGRIYQNSPFTDAAKVGDELISRSAGFTLSQLDSLCDEVLLAYLSSAKGVPFGDAPIIAYLAAKETEYTRIRTIMSGRIAGIAPDRIRQGLGIQ